MNSSMAKSIPMHHLLEPPMASVRPYPHHSHALALQQYLLLREQHESLRQHLDELRPPHQFTICAPVTPSPPSSPTRMPHSPDMPSRQLHSFSLPAKKTSYYGLTAGAGVDPELEGMPPHEAALAEVAIEEAKLCDVNEGLKRALTELLNCETVRADQAFRTWVQCRLMNTERELRSGRRRRSAPGA